MEPKGTAAASNLQFNVEFALINNDEINLSKRQKESLLKLRQGSLQRSILEQDL